MMNPYLKLASAAALAAAIPALPAFARGDGDPAPGPMMQGGSMMGMMQMMAACTEMMQVATPQPATPETTPQGG